MALRRRVNVTTGHEEIVEVPDEMVTQAQLDFLNANAVPSILERFIATDRGVVPTLATDPQYVGPGLSLVPVADDFYVDGTDIAGALVSTAPGTQLPVPFQGGGPGPTGPPVPIVPLPTPNPVPISRGDVVLGLDRAGIPILSAGALARFAPSIAGRLGSLFGRAMGKMDDIWDFLPDGVQTALRALGITETANLIFDLPGIPGDFPAFSDIFRGGDGAGNSATLAASLGVVVVGSWTANGVRFYRLADGRLAVQNKKGRWKVWRPKKPTVLYGTGAADLKTFLRADGILNRQSKKLAKALNRRSPRRSASKPPVHHEGHGSTITTVK